MAYIIVLNPIILSSAQDVAGNKLGFTQVSAMTSLAAGVVVVGRVRGGLLIGVVGGPVVGGGIEAVWHLGSAVKQPGGWTLSVPTLSGSPFALPVLPLAGDFSLGSFGRIGVLAAVML